MGPCLVLQFDCDGVLVDTERDGHRISFNEAFKRMGKRLGDHAIMQPRPMSHAPFGHVAQPAWAGGSWVADLYWWITILYLIMCVPRAGGSWVDDLYWWITLLYLIMCVPRAVT